MSVPGLKIVRSGHINGGEKITFQVEVPASSADRAFATISALNTSAPPRMLDANELQVCSIEDLKVKLYNLAREMYIQGSSSISVAVGADAEATLSLKYVGPDDRRE